MKIGKVSLLNYSSYKELEFDYSDLGLTLISGSTKAGKSTLLDASGWILFGETSKNLNADDVKSWFSDEETKGSIEVFLPGSTVSVTRIRGKRPTQNDLYFTVYDYESQVASDPIRGKDITDTQKLLNRELGVTPDLYFAASYIHQFSSDKFFTAKAKERRETMEKIANMELAIKLGELASEKRKQSKKDLEVKNQVKSKLEGKLDILKASLDQHLKSRQSWDKKHQEEIEYITSKFKNYKEDKENKVFSIVEQLEFLDKQIAPEESFKIRADKLRQQIIALEPVAAELKKITAEVSQLSSELKIHKKQRDKYESLKTGECPTCLSPIDENTKEQHLSELESVMSEIERRIEDSAGKEESLSKSMELKIQLQDKLQKIGIQEIENKRLVEKFKTLQAQAIALKEEQNPYKEQLETAKSKINPYLKETQQVKEALLLVEGDLIETQKEIQETQDKIQGLSWLYDKSYDLRGIFLSRSIKNINDVTNSILEKYFDATIRVDLALEESDELEIYITNEGYPAKYDQLSGGERCMLKLAFSIGYMQTAENTVGIKFETLMLDEAMNGLDADLKIKAFSLLQELESKYSTILLIDHEQAFKQMFANVFYVTKVGSYSHVEKDLTSP